MPLPRLYILHPPESRLPGVTAWLATAEARAGTLVEWNGCKFVREVYRDDASFNVPTVYGKIKAEPGPVILIQKVQFKCRDGLQKMVERIAQVTVAEVWNVENLWAIMEAAHLGYMEGHPLIPVRELLAYRIVRKLAAQDKWGGEAKNKAFLWEEDLPNGGFPAEFSEKREILNVANRLASVGILTTKTSQGKTKYALGEKSIVQPILDAQSFTGFLELRKFFERDTRRVSSRSLSTE